MNKIPHYINLALFILVLFLNLMIKQDHTKWYGFADPYDYLRQSKMGLTEKEFYFPHRTAEHCPRPFTTPLFYKIASSDPDRIVIMQKFVHTISIYLLVFSLLLFIRKSYVKYFVIFFVYLLMSWWNILGWTTTLLSESLSLSFMFLWIATFLIYLNKKTIPLLLLHVLITVLFSFTRDNWPYILIVFYFFVLVSGVWIDKKLIVSMSVMLVLCVGIFFIQGHSSDVGRRSRVPLLNVIVYKILPNNNYLQYFVNRGMPCSEKLQSEFGGRTPQDVEVFNMYKDSTYQQLFDWVDANGKSTYAKFLITHPSQSLLFHEKKSELKLILATSFGYTGEMANFSRLSSNVFPLFNPIVIIILLIILIILFARSKKMHFIIPMFLALIFLLNVFLVFNADAMETARHLFVTNIIIQILGIISVAFILDSKDFNEKLSAIYMKVSRKKVKNSE